MRRTALVTGGARGIGAATAEALDSAGWDVVIADIDAQAVAASVAAWAGDHRSIRGVSLDVTDRAAVAAMLDQHGPVTLVVNNAAVPADMLPFAELTPQHFERAMRINVVGSFIVGQEAARRMTEGAIVNVASRGYLGGIGGAHYVASKAAVVGLTRAMAIELRWRGIAVNAIAPGMVDTRMIAHFAPAMRARLTDLEPTGAALDPQIIADTIVFLGSVAGRAMSGQVLLVDGGKALGVAPF